MGSLRAGTGSAHIIEVMAGKISVGSLNSAARAIRVSSVRMFIGIRNGSNVVRISVREEAGASRIANGFLMLQTLLRFRTVLMLQTLFLQTNVIH